MNSTVAQTYVWHGDKAFFVSTIDRESSAALAHGMVYAETMVWNWNPETRERGSLIGQDEDCEGSIRTHQMVVDRLHRTGLVEIPEACERCNGSGLVSIKTWPGGVEVDNDDQPCPECEAAKAASA